MILCLFMFTGFVSLCKTKADFRSIYVCLYLYDKKYMTIKFDIDCFYEESSRNF